MKFINYTIICLLALSISSCDTKKSNFDYKKETIQVNCDFLKIDELIGSPYDITIRDSLLIYYDRYEGKLLSIFDLKHNQFVGRFLSEGNGPGEFIAPVDILPFPEKDELFLYQRNTAVISKFNISNRQTGNDMQISATGMWRPFEIQRTKDYFIGVGIFEGGRFTVYDLDGRSIKEGGMYPFEGEKMDKNQASLIYQGPYCANPEDNYFASGCVFSDYLAFYKIVDGEIIAINEYSSMDADVLSGNNSGNNYVAPKDVSTINYTYAFPTKSYYYMLFSGKTYKEKNKDTSGGNYIIQFDRDGNYIKTYETDHEIYNFFVDEANNLIYATAKNISGDKEIAKIKLK